jgi:putative exosortase-associated protein (TIGR04073 family)
MTGKLQRFGPVLLVGLLVAFLTSGAAMADTYRSVDDVSAEEVVAGMSAKASRGLVNVATGWLEFPRQIHSTYKEHGAVQGCLVGPFKGMGMMVVRTFSGALEFATFYLAFPGFYDPYLEPRYVWDDMAQ